MLNHINKVKAKLKKSDFNVHEIILPDGEEHKNLDTISNIYNKLISLYIYATK